MSATHRVRVQAREGAVVHLDVETIHPDEHRVPLGKAALLSLLHGSLWAGEAAIPDAVRDAYAEAGGDEPVDAREAGRVIRAVSEVRVLAGDVRAQNSRSVRFGAAGRVRVVLELRRPELAAHLDPGLSWDTAPLYGGM